MYVCRLYSFNNRAYKVYITNQFSVVCVIEIYNQQHIAEEIKVFDGKELTDVNDEYLMNKIKRVFVEHMKYIRSVIISLS